MRRYLVLLPLFLAAVAFLLPACTRENPPDPATVARNALLAELSDPASLWARTLRPETALADLGHFRDLPLHRVDADYDPQTHVLSGRETILYTNVGKEKQGSIFLTWGGALWESPGAAQPVALNNLVVNGKTAKFAREKALIQVWLPSALLPGRSVQVAFEFRVQIPAVGVAPGLPPTYGLADETVGLGAALIYAVSPDKELAARFLTRRLVDLHLTHPAGWTLVAGGAMDSPTTRTDGRTQTRLVATHSPVLFLTNRLPATSKQTAGGLNLTVHYRTGEERVAATMLDDMDKGLAALERVLGPAPRPAFHLLPRQLLNTKAMAMLNGGGLIICDPWLFRELEPERRFILLHELAHAWWGDLVSSDDLQAPAWQQGLADALAAFAGERVFGAAIPEFARHRWEEAYRLARQSGAPDLTLAGPVDPENPVSWTKTAVFFDQVRKEIGDDAFFRGLREYAEARRFTVTVDRGPIEVLLNDPQYGNRVEALYRRWILETHGDEDFGL